MRAREVDDKGGLMGLCFEGEAILGVDCSPMGVAVKNGLRGGFGSPRLAVLGFGLVLLALITTAPAWPPARAMS